MRTVAILPIKSFGAAKQRLGGLIGQEARSALMRAMLADVLDALGAVPALDVVVITANPLAAELAKRGVEVLPDEREAGQSVAASTGIRHAAQEGYERALLVPGDVPLLDARELTTLLARPERVVVVPDRHGTGTNGVLMAPVDAIEPSFGPGSRARHEAAARASGLSWAVDPVPSLVLDVDTPDDLEATARALEARTGGAPATRDALRRLRLAA